MRIDWLPFSASALVAGATALAVGSLLMPMGDSVAVGNDERLLAVAVLFFGAAVAMTLGLPAILILLEERSARLGLTAIAVFAVGCLGTAGYGMLLVFFRAVVRTGMLSDRNLDQITSDAGLTIFLFGWIGAFYLGELLIGIALLRARTTPVWVPALLVAHVGLFPISQLMPDRVSSLAVLLTTVGFAGIGIAANSRHTISSVRV